MQRHTTALLLCHNPLLDVCLSYRSCSVSLLDNWHYDFEYKILCCNFTGLSSVKSRSPGRVGLWAFCYYATTSVMAVFTGIVVVVLIKPGKTLGRTSAPPSGEKETMPTVDAFLDLIRYPSKRINGWIRLLLWAWTIVSSAASVLQERVSLKSGGGLFWTGETLGHFFVCVCFLIIFIMAHGNNDVFSSSPLFLSIKQFILKTRVLAKLIWLKRQI